MIPVYKPYKAFNQKKYVNQALDDNWLSSNGPFVKQFENKFAKFIGTKYAVSFMNGTCALEACVETIEPKEKRKPFFIIPNLCYIAVPNAIKNSGGSFIVGDIDPITMNLNIEDIKKNISVVDCLLYVYNYGNPSNVQEIKNLCLENDVIFIENVCEAFGTEYMSKKLGSWGDLGVFSFFGNKTITTGEGGMVVTDNEKLYINLQLIRSHGGYVDSNFLAKYDHLKIGHNFRMTNIQAGIGLAQLEDFDIIRKKKNQVYSWYYWYLAPKYLPDHNPYIDLKHFTNWLFYIFCDNRDKMVEYLHDNGIETRIFFKDIMSFSFHGYCKSEIFPNSTYISSRGINLPSYPDLTEEQVKFISETINRFKNE